MYLNYHYKTSNYGLNLPQIFKDWQQLAKAILKYLVFILLLNTKEKQVGGSIGNLYVFSGAVGAHRFE